MNTQSAKCRAQSASAARKARREVGRDGELSWQRAAGSKLGCITTKH
jgi:hypothetical protein